MSSNGDDFTTNEPADTRVIGLGCELNCVIWISMSIGSTLQDMHKASPSPGGIAKASSASHLFRGARVNGRICFQHKRKCPSCPNRHKTETNIIGRTMHGANGLSAAYALCQFDYLPATPRNEVRIQLAAYCLALTPCQFDCCSGAGFHYDPIGCKLSGANGLSA